MSSQWQQRHPGVKESSLVRGWVATIYPVAMVAAKFRVHPHAVTLAAVLVAWTAVLFAWRGDYFVGVLLVLTSAYLDGLDGAVASLRGKSSALGARLDRFADRLSELAFGAVLVAWGASVLPAVTAWVSTLVLEGYRSITLRRRQSAAHAAARAGSGALPHDSTKIQVPLTIAERPTRVIIVIMFGLGAGCSAAGFSLAQWAQPAQWATAAAMAWGGVNLVGLAQLARRFQSSS